MIQNWEKLEREIALHRLEVTDRLTDFARTDVMLFLSTDKQLLEEQKNKWFPVVNWVNQTVNADFKPTSSLDPAPVSKNFLQDFKSYLSSFSDKEMAVFYATALDMHSVLLALALVKGRINAVQAFELSELEELFQVRSWGREPVAEARRKSLRQNLLEAEKYLKAA